MTTSTENYLRRTQTYSDSIQVKWFQDGEEQQVILVKLTTFNDLVTRVAQLEQQIGTLFGTAGQNETDLTQVTSQISSIFAFVTNHAARLNAAGL